MEKKVKEVLAKYEGVTIGTLRLILARLNRLTKPTRAEQIEIGVINSLLDNFFGPGVRPGATKFGF